MHAFDESITNRAAQLSFYRMMRGINITSNSTLRRLSYIYIVQSRRSPGMKQDARLFLNIYYEDTESRFSARRLASSR